MKTKDPNLEVKLESLKDQFIAALKSTKLIVNPEINGLTLTYEKRRGALTCSDCKSIQLGLKVMLKKLYNGNADIFFEEANESRGYKATLEVLAETNQGETQLAYDALTKINQFIEAYKELRKK
ncbi:MAG: hypothetical protein WC979_05620 [Candidatus Pacearchaeota archaeon]|jgi:hypothetical protein